MKLNFVFVFTFQNDEKALILTNLELAQKNEMFNKKISDKKNLQRI